METNFLANQTLDAFPKVPIIHHVESTASASDALKILSKYNILSAPILDVTNNTYIGMVDMLDLVTYLISLFNSMEREGEDSDFLSVLEQGERFASENVKTLVDFSKQNPFVPIKHNSSLLDVLILFGKNKINRVPVIDEEGKVINLITQSAVVDYLAHNSEKLEKQDKLSQTILTMLPHCEPVVTADIGSRAVDAFTLMATKRVGAVAVVDERKHLIANISARDIRTIASDIRVFQNLYLPIRNFLHGLYSERMKATNPGISCKPEDTLNSILGKLVVTKVHRVYVVDSQNRAVGAITLHDVINALITE